MFIQLFNKQNQHNTHISNIYNNENDIIAFVNKFYRFATRVGMFYGHLYTL